MTCPLGGGVVARHHAVRDALAGWLQSVGIGTATEQVVPAWSRDNEEARLDIAYHDQREGPMYLDVSVVASAQRAPDGHGRLLSRRERAKHQRYPGRNLIPFVLDVRGRWGMEARAWLKTMVGSMDEDRRSEALQSCRWLVSQALQASVAEQGLRSAGSGGQVGSRRSWV